MSKIYKTTEEATRAWVAEMNQFPLDMLLAATDDGMGLEDITPYTDEEMEEIENNGQDWPMWPYLFQFSDSSDIAWGESEEGMETLRSCGFRIYHTEQWGDFLAIDGCGYSFIHEHWMPLYKARGFRWSEED